MEGPASTVRVKSGLLQPIVWLCVCVFGKQLHLNEPSKNFITLSVCPHTYERSKVQAGRSYSLDRQHVAVATLRIDNWAVLFELCWTLARLPKNVAVKWADRMQKHLDNFTSFIAFNVVHTWRQTTMLRYRRPKCSLGFTWADAAKLFKYCLALVVHNIFIMIV